MSNVSRRGSAAALTLGAALAVTPTASAKTTITSSTAYAYAGSSVTLKVSSDTAGPIEVRQARISRIEGAGRCSIGDTFSGKWVAGSVLATVPYPEPGKVVTVKVAATKLEFLRGNFLSYLPDSSPPESQCKDYPTQFTQIGAWQWVADVGTTASFKPLVRVF